MAKKGCEELSTARALGDFLFQEKSGRCKVLRGKYRGRYINEVPRGYVRKFILTAWREDMNPLELEIFEHYGKKEEAVEDKKDKVTEAFEKVAAEGGSVEVPLTDEAVKVKEADVEVTRTEATDEELEESKEVIESLTPDAA